MVSAEHRVTAGLSVVEAADERYLSLAVSPDVQVLVVADHEGAAHPVVWVVPGPARGADDALGHDVRSYDSPCASTSSAARSAGCWDADVRSRGRMSS